MRKITFPFCIEQYIFKMHKNILRTGLLQPTDFGSQAYNETQRTTKRNIEEKNRNIYNVINYNIKVNRENEKKIARSSVFKKKLINYNNFMLNNGTEKKLINLINNQR